MTRSADPPHEPMPEDFGFRAQSGQQNAEYGQYLNRLGQCIVAGITGLPLRYVRPLWLPRPGRQPALTTNWCGVGYGLVENELNPVRLHMSCKPYETVARHEILRFSTVFYGSDAMGNASKLRDELVADVNLLALKRMGFTYRDSSPVTPAPDLVNQVWVERADFSFTVRRHTRRAYTQDDYKGAKIALFSQTISLQECASERTDYGSSSPQRCGKCHGSI
ncbi:phage neck terminator protein [Entomobacter blattae]|uniref:Phage neck terminator protein gp12-like domain-containing protein n=1 Tax=Entomobacter blattae TaxID=2762277 RepID=A0A7H1NTY7_9PROT|nr:hypothetical protein [Entomobacter blattae]QNT79247.1 hypothetical protein JGUZn3_20420 [Entomobacter blattae]